MVPTTNGSSPTSGSTAGIVVATVARSRVARASAAPARRKSSAPPHAEPDEQDQAELGVVRGAQRDRERGHLAGLAASPASALEQREQVDAQRSPTSSAPGPSSGASPSSPGSTGQRDDVHAGEGVRVGSR